MWPYYVRKGRIPAIVGLLPGIDCGYAYTSLHGVVPPEIWTCPAWVAVVALASATWVPGCRRDCRLPGMALANLSVTPQNYPMARRNLLPRIRRLLAQCHADTIAALTETAGLKAVTDLVLVTLGTTPEESGANLQR